MHAAIHETTPEMDVYNTVLSQIGSLVYIYRQTASAQCSVGRWGESQLFQCLCTAVRTTEFQEEEQKATAVCCSRSTESACHSL